MTAILYKCLSSPVPPVNIDIHLSSSCVITALHPIFIFQICFLYKRRRSQYMQLRIPVTSDVIRVYIFKPRRRTFAIVTVHVLIVVYSRIQDTDSQPYKYGVRLHLRS